MAKIIITKDWIPTTVTPPENEPIAFLVDRIPAPVAGFYENGIYHQSFIKRKLPHSEPIIATVNYWRKLDVKVG